MCSRFLNAGVREEESPCASGKSSRWGLAGVGYTDCKHKIVELKMCALGPSSPAGRLA